MEQSPRVAVGALLEFVLDKKYDSREGGAQLSGIQALTRLPIEQRWRDQAAGLNTGGFISGYRGSPTSDHWT